MWFGKNSAKNYGDIRHEHFFSTKKKKMEEQCWLAVTDGHVNNGRDFHTGVLAAEYVLE